MDETAENLALGRQATQSSVCSWSTDPDPNIDASIATNGDITSPAFFHTNKQMDPWWQVDLGDEYLIQRVVIFNRTDIPERLSRFTLLRSFDGEFFPDYALASASNYD